MVAAGENLTLAGIAKQLSELSGKKYETKHTTKEQFMDVKDKMDGEVSRAVGATRRQVTNCLSSGSTTLLSSTGECR